MPIHKPAVPNPSEQYSKQELALGILYDAKFSKASKAGLARLIQSIKESSQNLMANEGLVSNPGAAISRLRELFNLLESNDLTDYVKSYSSWRVDKTGAAVSKISLRNPDEHSPVENIVDLTVRRHTEQSRQEELQRLSYKGLSPDNIYFNGPGISATEITLCLTEVDRDPNSTYVKINKSSGVALAIGPDNKLVDIRGVLMENGVRYTSDSLMVPNDDLTFDEPFIKQLDVYAGQ